FAAHAAMLAAGVFLIGMASSVFLLARQSYMIDAVPVHMRARALSTLAGTMRIGVFAGPFAGAALIHFTGLQGAYWVAVAAMAGAGMIARYAPDMRSEEHTSELQSRENLVCRLLLEKKKTTR